MPRPPRSSRRERRHERHHLHTLPDPDERGEAINHVLRYRSTSGWYTFVQATPTAGGEYTPVKIEQRALFAYAVPGATIESIGNKAIYFLEEVLAPPRLAGEILLVHETLNQVAEPRQAWTYNPGQRRVRRAPNVAYDNPGTACDGQRTADQLDMFNGAPRYGGSSSAGADVMPYTLLLDVRGSPTRSCGPVT
jgi:hypothetical protein